MLESLFNKITGLGNICHVTRLQDLLPFGKVGESEKSFNSSVISQKGESVRANTYVCVSGGKKCSFFGKFGVLCFLETPVLRFALLPYYRRFPIRNIYMSNNYKFHYIDKLKKCKTSTADKYVPYSGIILSCIIPGVDKMVVLKLKILQYTLQNM